MTTVMICDDDPISRHVLGGHLDREEGLEVVALVSTAVEVLDSLEEQRADVLLMDASPLGMHGTDAAREVRDRHPSTAVLMMTSSGTQEQVREALSVGASGFLLKETAPAVLTAAVRAAADEAGTVLAPELAVQLSAAPPPAPGPTAEPAVAAVRIEALGLTEREVQVLTLLCGAASNAGIARELTLSESTVKTHVSSLMGKLDCSSRLQIALAAFERGLVEPPRPPPANR